MSARTARPASRFRVTWARRVVQVAALLLFASPLLMAGWGLLGLGTGGDDAVATPAELPFFGSLSSSTVGGVEVLDPFALLRCV